MIISDKMADENLENKDIDFSEDGRYHSQPSMEDDGWLEFLDILSRMLINYKHKEDKDHV